MNNKKKNEKKSLKLEKILNKSYSFYILWIYFFNLINEKSTIKS